MQLVGRSDVCHMLHLPYLVVAAAAAPAAGSHIRHHTSHLTRCQAPHQPHLAQLQGVKRVRVCSHQHRLQLRVQGHLYGTERSVLNRLADSSSPQQHMRRQGKATGALRLVSAEHLYTVAGQVRGPHTHIRTARHSHTHLLNDHSLGMAGQHCVCTAFDRVGRVSA